MNAAVTLLVDVSVNVLADVVTLIPLPTIVRTSCALSAAISVCPATRTVEKVLSVEAMVTVSVPALVVISIPVLAANVNVSVAESAATLD